MSAAALILRPVCRRGCSAAQPPAYRDPVAADRRPRPGSPRPHDARGEVLAAVHDPRRSRRPGARLLERHLRSADLRRAARRHAAARAATPSGSTPSSATSSSRRGSASRSSRSRRRCTACARDGATMFPQAIALAATWDTALVGARRRGRRARDAAAAASARCSRRSSTSPTTCAGGGWRRPTARIRTCRR